MDTVTYGAAIAYVKQTANALGAVKGAPCTVKSITESEEGSTVVFAWTGNDGVQQTSTAFIPRGPIGKQGDPGDPGKNGISPSVKVSEINGGHRVTITDANGTHTFDVMDGVNGTGGTVEVDTTLTEAGKAADAKAVGDAIGKVSEEIVGLNTFKATAFEEKTKSTNILNPEKLKNGWYYDFDDGKTKIESPYAMFTEEFIEVDNDVKTLYFKTNYPKTGKILAVYCYSDDTKYLGYVIGEVTQNEYFSLGLRYAGTTKIRIYTNATEILTYGLYVSSKIGGSEEYEKSYFVKVSALPKLALPQMANSVIVNFGDSIFGNKRPPNDISTELSHITGATVYNCGFGGARMAKSVDGWDAFSMYRLADAIATQDFSIQDAVDIRANSMPSYFGETLSLLKSIDFSKVDIITIAYGMNDFTNDVMLDSTDKYGTNKYAGALRHSIETLLNAYPNLKIFICGQTYRFWMDSAGAFTEDSDTKVFGAGIPLTDFVEKTQEIAKEYHLPFIDNYYELGINKYNRTYYFPANDGTHHNELGALLIAEHIASKLF